MGVLSKLLVSVILLLSIGYGWYHYTDVSRNVVPKLFADVNANNIKMRPKYTHTNASEDVASGSIIFGHVQRKKDGKRFADDVVTSGGEVPIDILSVAGDLGADTNQNIFANLQLADSDADVQQYDIFASLGNGAGDLGDAILENKVRVSKTLNVPSPYLDTANTNSSDLFDGLTNSNAFFVQVAYSRNKSEAEGKWVEISERYPKLTKKYSFNVHSKVKNDVVFYQGLVGPLEFFDAKQLCNKLTQNKYQCVMVPAVSSM